MCSDVAALAFVNAALISLVSLVGTWFAGGDWNQWFMLSTGTFLMVLTIILQCLWGFYHG